MSVLVETDARGRVTLPGHSNQPFWVRENSDGSLLLEPVRVDAQAQADYDSTPELRELLARAQSSATVARRYKRR